MKLISKTVFALLIVASLLSQGGRFLLNTAHAGDDKPTKEGGSHPHPREGSGASCG